MNCILGGSMSSRLFQKVREELGLAYTVYSYVSPFEEVGSLVVYAGVNPENYLKCYDAVFDCINYIKKKNITNEEFLRGKEQLISSSIFAQESTSSQMLLYGRELIYSDKIYNFEERVEKVKRMTVDEVFEAIDVNFDEKYLAAALIGNADKPLDL